MLRKLRLVWKSRGIFSNWLQLCLDYLLGKSELRVKCRDGEATISRKAYVNMVRAYYYGVFKSMSCGVSFKFDGFELPGTWLESILALPCAKRLKACFDEDSVKLTYFNHEIILPKDAAAPFMYDILCENFGGAYDDFNVKDRVVIDIGAGIGDTPVMFAARGAKRVIALEPFPAIYRKAVKVIQINNFEGKVTLLNAALGNADKVVEIEDCDFEAYLLFSPTAVTCRGQKTAIPIYSLKTLTEKFESEELVLKVDCEGCEYEALTDVETLKKFKEIAVEYHEGPQPLIDILRKAGFATKLSPIKSLKIPIERQGYIIAFPER
ncbi:MAG: FkbM family methyltransferase [Thermoprotei archaeon]|nr:FkbM family methyltransferase [Thermoprotei archaeon]